MSEPTAAATAPAPGSFEEDARARIFALEREAKARGSDPSAALLFHEIGLLWEEALKNPRNAAVAYQNAYKLAPGFVANIRAARRLFSEVGNWQMAAQLIEAEIAATSEHEEKLRLGFEKAQVLEQRLSRLEEAQRAYAQVLEGKPTDLPLLVQLEQVFAERADLLALTRVYRLISKTVELPALKAQYLTSAGYLLEDRLEKPDEAAECFRAAFAIERKDPLLLAAIKRVASRTGAHDELLTALAVEAELAGRDAAPIFMQISSVYESLGRRDDALAALQAARRISPTDPLVLSELAQIFEAHNRFDELADILLAWATCATDEAEVVAINLRLAGLYEETLKRETDAITRYQAILSRIPGHSQALAGLGKLYYRNQDWAGLLATYDAELAALEDPRQKAARMYKAAEVLEERLGRQEEAIARYGQCLQLSPGYLPAQKALTRLFERQGRFSDLVGMYEQDLLLTTDREQSISTLYKIAALYEDRLKDLDHAIECMKRVLELASDHLPTVRNLARLYERAGKWRELVQIHELEASLASDTKQVLSLHHRTAELLEDQLQDRAGAISAYERLLALSPSYLPALKALGRLYAQEGRWEQLVQMYRSEAEISASSEQAASLIFKIGELYERRIGKLDDAIAAYQEVLTLAPAFFPALRALARLYSDQQAWESLVEVLRAEAANRTDPLERANSLFQAGTIWETQLGKPQTAAEIFQEVLRLAPGHVAALRTLERLAIASGDLAEQIRVLERQTQSGAAANKVAAYLRLARLYLDRKNEPARAIQCCEAALAIDPSNVGALRLVTRMRSTDRARRAELKQRLAEAVRDEPLGTALRLSAVADLDSTGLPSADGALPSGLLAALKFSAPTGLLGSALEKSLRQAQDFASLAKLFETRLGNLTDKLEQIELCLRLADLYETRLSDLPRAAQAFERALAIDPALLPALLGAARVCVKLGEAAKARTFLEAAGAASGDLQGAVEAFVQSGRLALHELKNPDEAAQSFRRALEKEPLNSVANAALEEILASRGGGTDLATLHVQRAEAKLAQRDLPAAAAEFYAAARLYLDSLHDPAGAQNAVDRALAANAVHPEALELKGELCLASQQYAEAAAVFGVRVQQGGDALHLSRFHQRLGALYQDHLSDATRAAAHLQTALASNPGDLEALDRLANIHTVSRNWTGAADCLRRLLELDARPASQARHTVALARIIDEGFGDHSQATELYRKALELAPGDTQILERLSALYQADNNLPQLVYMLEQQVLSAPPELAQKLWKQIAELYAQRLRVPARAIASYKKLLELDPSDLEAHAALAELLALEPSTVPAAIEQHRLLLRHSPTRLDSLHALFNLWHSQGQKDQAFCAAGVLGFFNAATQPEADFYAEARSRLPMEPAQHLAAEDVELLLHPLARGPVADVLRAIGDQLGKLYPPAFEQLGIDKKADRLKPEHAIHRAVRQAAQIFSVEEFEVYQARRGMVHLETGEPLIVCVDQDVARKYNAREQKFLLGRAALGLFNKTSVLPKLSPSEAEDLFGNSVRIHVPEYSGLGRRSDEQTKALRKAYSRKALKALEEPAQALSRLQRLDLGSTLEALRVFSQDRAGLLVCGDVAAGLTMLLRTDTTFSGVRQEGSDAVAQAVRQRLDLRELTSYAVSEEFFRLRQKVGIAAG